MPDVPAETQTKSTGKVDVQEVSLDHRAYLLSAFDRWALRTLRAGLADARVRLALWNGTTLYDEPNDPLATVRIANRRTLWNLLRHRDIAFGNGFRTGQITIDGDLVACVEAGLRVAHKKWIHQSWRDRPFPKRPNTVAKALTNACRHYDLGNDFYRLWLDRRMVYTAGYYSSDSTRLDDAQTAKLELVCRELGLRAGERVVEAGSGWGALALYMARHYGVTVRSFNVSREQVVYARRMAQQESLASRVEFIEDDYRNITGRYDAFVSIGMLEHVGPEHYAILGRVIDQCLPLSGGRGLLHFIGRDRPQPLNPWVQAYVFPGTHPPALSNVTRAIFEPRAFSIRRLENFRLHYARTCADWLRRLEAVEQHASAAVGAEAYRTWRLYLAASQAAFRTGWLQDFQILFSRSGDDVFSMPRSVPEP